MCFRLRVRARARGVFVCMCVCARNSKPYLKPPKQAKLKRDTATQELEVPDTPQMVPDTPQIRAAADRAAKVQVQA
jgi:hypothetical protein